jgi:hypothetical protein
LTHQACNFLQAAVAGTPNLASVYQTWNINNRNNLGAANRELQFLEYIQLLILNAQVYDASKKGCSKSKLSVNLTDLAFEEIKTEDMILEVNEHDIDPTYGQFEVNVNHTKHNLVKSSTVVKTGPRKVFVDCDTWRSLSQADQNTWNKLTVGTKTRIIAYGVKKGKQLTTESQSTEKHSVIFHDVQFNDDNSDVGNEPAALEVGTHKLQLEIVHTHRGKKKTSFTNKGQSTASDKDSDVLLSLVTAQNTSKDLKKHGIDVNQVISERMLAAHIS